MRVRLLVEFECPVEGCTPSVKCLECLRRGKPQVKAALGKPAGEPRFGKMRVEVRVEEVGRGTAHEAKR